LQDRDVKGGFSAGDLLLVPAAVAKGRLDRVSGFLFEVRYELLQSGTNTGRSEQGDLALSETIAGASQNETEPDDDWPQGLHGASQTLFRTLAESVFGFPRSEFGCHPA